MTVNERLTATQCALARTCNFVHHAIRERSLAAISFAAKFSNQSAFRIDADWLFSHKGPTGHITIIIDCAEP